MSKNSSMRYQEIKFDHLLGAVEKPGRYTNNEINACHRKPDSQKICFCLAYPDLYEVGFSHLGLKILYSILNRQPDAMADRVFVPSIDMVNQMLADEVPLFALESRAAVRDFDVLGITLQSELTYTNILLLLKLAGISIKCADRSEDDPVILAGGPGSSNPLPLADFIDVFLIGDGEEAINKIKDCLIEKKGRSRQEKLMALNAMEGLYVPQYYNKEQGRIKAQKFMNFDDPVFMAQDQLVPWLQPTHDRFVCEIMRGCSRGCRFCHAGYFYRPLREKSPEIIKEQAMNEIEHYGWEELALTSLSSSDYSMIKELLVQLAEESGSRQTRLSLPSLRVDSLDETLTGLMNEMQQKSITIAPEAGSQRLRDVINKNFTEAEILAGVQAALQNGWRLLKLYFMIGLPFEEDPDIEAIAALVEKIIDCAGRRLQINITVSPFVPKPFTPFQWAKAAEPNELKEKVFYLKERLRKYKFVKLKYHTIEYQSLECALGRGDRQAGKLLEAAFNAGAVFDGWDEHFNYDFWLQAQELCGVRIADYRQEIDFNVDLPWSFIDVGVTEEFLRNEFQKAKLAQTTQDCRHHCSGCGLCDDKIMPLYHKKIKKSESMRTELPMQDEISSYRVFYQKGQEVRYIGHLDMLRMTYRLVRASGLPILYSQGYNRHPQVSFGPPLPLGMMSDCEYFDIKLAESELPVSLIREKLKRVFPPGMNIRNVETPVTKAMRSMEFYSEEEIAIEIPGIFIDLFKSRLNEFWDKSHWEYTRKRSGKQKMLDLKEIIQEICLDNSLLLLRKKVSGASIYEILESVFRLLRKETGDLKIIRTRLFR